MPRHVMKALAAVLASTGALASTGGDAVVLVQRELQRATVSTDAARVDQGFASVLSGMLGAIKVESAIRKELGASDVPGQCTTDDRKATEAKATSAAADMQGKSPEAIASMLPVECTKAMSAGIPNFNSLGTCMEKFLGISKACSGCTTTFLKGVTNMFSGCIAGCMPMATSCQSAAKEGKPSGACLKAASKCMKCNHPHYKKYSACVGGSPNIDETMRLMDEVYDDMASGKISMEDGTKKLMDEISKKAAEKK